MSAKHPPLKQSNLSVLERMKQQQPILSAEVSDDITVGDFARYWLKHLKTDVKDSTRYSYESAISTHICRVFENMKLSAVTAEDVQLFIMSLSDGMDLEDPLSPKTIRNIHGVLHRLMQDAFDMKLIDENPAKHTKLPKKQPPELVPMNTNQVHDFLNAITGSPLEAFYKLALFTGMRKAELIGLTWDEPIANQEELLWQATADYEQKQKALADSSDTLATAEKVFGGTYVQHLVAEERERRETRYISNGMKFANGGGI